MYFKNLFYSILAYFSFLHFTSIIHAGDDITDPYFTISLCTMDPMNQENCGGESGTDALISILGKFSDLLLFTLPLIAGLSIIIAGYFYIFSSGDTEKANRGKTIIKWNIVAIIVALSSTVLIRLVASFFN